MNDPDFLTTCLLVGLLYLGALFALLSSEKK